MPKKIPVPVKKTSNKVPEPKLITTQIHPGSRVTVKTVFIVKRVIESEGSVVLVAVDDHYADRTLTFRKEELLVGKGADE